jgi:hypothetical protein
VSKPVLVNIACLGAIHEDPGDNIRSTMIRLEQIWEKRTRRRALLVSAGTILAIAADWRITPYISLGLVYLFPTMLAAGFLPRWAILSYGCETCSDQTCRAHPAPGPAILPRCRARVSSRCAYGHSSVTRAQVGGSRWVG